MVRIWIATVAIALIGIAPAVAAPVQGNGLAGALIAAGGGAGSYSTVRALTSIIGDEAAQTELTTIRTRAGNDAGDRFVHEFDYAISDAWTRAGQDNVTFPDSAQRGRELGKALYLAGMQSGGFSGQAWLAGLLTPRVWNDVSHDLDAKYGAGSSSAFAAGVGALFADLGPQLQ